MKDQDKITSDKEFLEAADDVAVLANLITRRKAKLEKELQDVRGEYEPEIESLDATMIAKKKGMIAYLKRKGVPQRLFRDGQKQGESGKAVFGFRFGKTAVKTLDTKARIEEVAAALLLVGKSEFVRQPEQPAPTINAQAVLDAGMDGEQLAALGLRLVQTENFYCELKDSVITR